MSAGTKFRNSLKRIYGFTLSKPVAILRSFKKSHKRPKNNNTASKNQNLDNKKFDYIQYLQTLEEDRHFQEQSRPTRRSIDPKLLKSNDLSSILDSMSINDLGKGMKKMFGKMYPNCVKKTKKEDKCEKFST